MSLVTFLLTVLLALTAIAAPSPPKRHLGPSLSEFFEAHPLVKRAEGVSATAQICTEANLSGQCYSATLPTNECIWLNGFSGHVLSFLPEDGYECMLFQGECDAEDYYLDFAASLGTLDDGLDLSGYEWIAEANSYMCFTAVSASSTATERVVGGVRVGISRGKAVNVH